MGRILINIVGVSLCLVILAGWGLDRRRVTPSPPLEATFPHGNVIFSHGTNQVTWDGGLVTSDMAPTLTLGPSEGLVTTGMGTASRTLTTLGHAGTVYTLPATGMPSCQQARVLGNTVARQETEVP